MRRLRCTTLLVAAASVALATSAIASAPATSAGSGLRVGVTPLIADRPGFAPHVDPALANAWGLAFAPGSPIWVADNGTDSATLYTGGVHGSPVTTASLVVHVVDGAPTGQVFNGTSGFVVHDGSTSGSALFLLSSEAGDIVGWSPSVGGGSVAVRGAHVADAIYKGLAIATAGGRTLLYATDFHHNRVDVFDDHFNRLSMPGRFVDPHRPAHYAPFGIQELNGRIYVTYAEQDADAHDDLHGPGLGLVDVYTTAGVFVRRLVSHAALDAPWGLVIAPSSFGSLAGSLLVGNFGDGRIHAYDATTGALRGTLETARGEVVAIDGLWGLIVGNGTFGGTDEVVFSAGPDDESHGLVGTITPS